MNIRVMPVELVHQHWDQVEPYLSAAIEQGGCTEYNVDQLRAMIVSGKHELLVAVDADDKIKGAATVTFINHPKCRVAFVTAIGGRLISSQDTWAQFSEWMRDRGATKCHGAVRESVARLWARYGFRERHRIVEVDL
jgi:hypothetical protein